MTVSSVEEFTALPVGQSVRVMGGGTSRDWSKNDDGWRYSGGAFPVGDEHFTGAVLAGSVTLVGQTTPPLPPMPDPNRTPMRGDVLQRINDPMYMAVVTEINGDTYTTAEFTRGGEVWAGMNSRRARHLPGAASPTWQYMHVAPEIVRTHENVRHLFTTDVRVPAVDPNRPVVGDVIRHNTSRGYLAVIVTVPETANGYFVTEQFINGVYNQRTERRARYLPGSPEASWSHVPAADVPESIKTHETVRQLFPIIPLPNTTTGMTEAQQQALLAEIVRLNDARLDAAATAAGLPITRTITWSADIYANAVAIRPLLSEVFPEVEGCTTGPLTASGVYDFSFRVTKEFPDATSCVCSNHISRGGENGLDALLPAALHGVYGWRNYSCTASNCSSA